MYIFTTFASKNMSEVSSRIKKEAEATGLFGKIVSYNEAELTPELLASDTFKIKKGFGHYSWKPDVIYQTLQRANDGDIVVYCDAGSKLQSSSEWKKFSSMLEKYDILGFRMHQRNYKWTRRTVFEYFKDDIKTDWKNLFQFCANAIIVKKSPAGLKFIEEWRSLMINRLDLCGDVPPEELKFEDPRLIENRYDQTIMTALLYKYINAGAAYGVWEHLEGYDFIKKQAVIAARIRPGRKQNLYKNPKHIIWRIVRTYILYPYYKMLYRLA